MTQGLVHCAFVIVTLQQCMRPQNRGHDGGKILGEWPTQGTTQRS